MSGSNLVWTHMSDFEIKQVHSSSWIWNCKYDFQPKFEQHKVQSPLYYMCFEIAKFSCLEFFSVYK